MIPAIFAGSGRVTMYVLPEDLAERPELRPLHEAGVWPEDAVIVVEDEKHGLHWRIHSLVAPSPEMTAALETLRPDLAGSKADMLAAARKDGAA